MDVLPPLDVDDDYVTYGEPEESPEVAAAAEVYVGAMLEMSPEDVIALYRAIDSRDEHGALLVDEQALYGALRRLPERNLEHARTVFRAGADSASTVDRRLMAGVIEYLTPHEYDHDLAMELWFRLVRDGDHGVRGAAINNFTYHPDDLDEWDPAFLTWLSITADEADALMDAYNKAEAGSTPPFDLVRHLARHALQKLTEHIQAAEDPRNEGHSGA